MIPGALRIAKNVSTIGEAKEDLTKLKKATDGLESFMFKTLLQSMGGKKGLFGSNVPGADVYRDMFETNLSDVMASRGSLRIGKSIFDKVTPMALAQAHSRLLQSTIEKKV